MKNIWYQKSKKRANIKMIISILAFAIIILWSVYGINLASDANKEQQKIELKTSLDKAAALCYAIEGMYPPDIEYLEENYGVNIDKNKYVINYDIFASNYRPQITVFYMED